MQAIILFAHGSRDPLWRTPIEAVAAKIREKSPAILVRCAYLELCEPSLPDAVRELAEKLNATNSGAAPAVSTGDLAHFNTEKRLKIRIVPMFLGMGRHAREDLPQIIEELRERYPKIEFESQSAVGEHPALIELLSQIAVAASP